MMFSIQDLAIAKVIRDNASKVDQFGVRLYSNRFVRWANKVYSFFNNIYNLARSFRGHWTARIKLAWATIQGVVKKTVKRISKALKGAVRLPSGELYIKDSSEPRSYGTIRPRIKRYFKQN